MGESADSVWAASQHMIGVEFDTWLTAPELGRFHGPAIMTFEVRVIENVTMFRPLVSMDPPVFQGYTVIFSEPPGVSQPAPDSGNGDNDDAGAQEDAEEYDEAAYEEPPRPSRRQDRSSGSSFSSGKSKGKDKGMSKGKASKGKGKGVR
eukprot:TRINITY_DN4899_c1_g2_i1.p2 TRINITY_DN4899_c1_g2~~TRINITY_DN4899_c1_g2_i1.p2  ORF type:complete len:149 (-),score=33.41 TRINITY_DN4899_c1_g2_i1:88-534(-)